MSSTRVDLEVPHSRLCLRRNRTISIVAVVRRIHPLCGPRPILSAQLPPRPAGILCRSCITVGAASSGLGAGWFSQPQLQTLGVEREQAAVARQLCRRTNTKQFCGRSFLEEVYSRALPSAWSSWRFSPAVHIVFPFVSTCSVFFFGVPVHFAVPGSFREEAAGGSNASAGFCVSASFGVR